MDSAGDWKSPPQHMDFACGLSAYSPKDFHELSRDFNPAHCHAHADRDPVRALPAGTRLTKDGVDAWLDKEKLLPGQIGNWRSARRCARYLAYNFVKDLPMPEISRFFGIIIRMYFNDHVPPHFHADYGEHSIEITIETLEVWKGKLPNRVLGLVLEWASLHRDELRTDWERARNEQPLEPIQPLE